MNNKKAVFSTLFCIFIAALFILGCNNHLLKPQQDEPRLLVKIANSTGARNATTTGEWQISAWIENRDGTKSHQQEISTKENNFILTFENIVIGSQINIHLELTKNDDNQTKLTGESGWTTIKEGVNVIVIVLREISSTGEDESDSPASGENQAPDPSTPAEPPAIVNAETPTIAEINSVIEPYPTDPKPVTTTLEAVASVTDGGTLTYQWYSNTTNSTANGTLIGGATNATYEATVDAGTTKYFYCVVTNTNNSVNGTKTASATSNVATVASIEGTLTGITAHYTGTHELVNSEINYSNIEIVQVYTIPDAEPQEISVVASSVKDQYTIVLQEPTNAIGNVPATVIHTETKKQTTVDIPVKYQLDEVYLSGAVDSTIAQYTGSHSLSATYNDTSVSLKLYQNNTSSELTDYVNYTWYPSTVDNTKTTSYTLTLSSKNEWCILPSEGITKEVTVTVTPWILEINSDSPKNLAGGQGYTLTATNTSGTATGITYESDNTSFSISSNTLTTPAATTSPQSATIAAKYNGQTLDTLEVTVPAEAAPSDGILTQEQLVQAIANASPDDTITLSNTITITETLVIDKNIRIEGSGNISLLRATGTVTGPMIEIQNCEVDLYNITLDGQWNNSNTDGENNPLIYVNNDSTLLLTNMTLTNNHMVYWGQYTDSKANRNDLYTATAIYALDSNLMIMDSTFTNFSDNYANIGGVINIEATYSGGASITISDTTIEASRGNSKRALQMGSNTTKFGYISYDINNTFEELAYQITSITPDSP